MRIRANRRNLLAPTKVLAKTVSCIGWHKVTTSFITEDMVEQGALDLLRDKLGYAITSGRDSPRTVTPLSASPTSRFVLTSRLLCVPTPTAVNPTTPQRYS